MSYLRLTPNRWAPTAVDIVQQDRGAALRVCPVFAADDAAEARRQVMTGALSMLRLRTGRPGLVPTPEEAEAYPFSPLEREFADSWLSNVEYGTARTVRDGLDALAKRTGADELMITSNAHSPAARLRSFDLIADAYDLPEASA